MSHFRKGFASELLKVSSMGGASAAFAAKNLLFHAIMNTKLAPTSWRRFLTEAGDDFMAAGFRHAIQGKRIGHGPGAIIGTAAGANPMYLYNTGYQYGKKVSDTMKKIPLAKATTPFKTLKGADTAASAGIKAAPVAGGLAGAGYGYTTGKTKREPYPVKSILAGAASGALLGKGIKHYGPQAPVFKQLKFVREKVVNPVIDGSQSSTGKILDRIAKPAKG